MVEHSDGSLPSGIRQLILMRHAKSDWADESLSDHDRPLNKRGRRDAPRMAQWLAEVGLVPNRILSSSSARTCETTELLLEQWSELGIDPPETRFSESLYLAAPESILYAIQSDAGDAQRLMVIAHNPGMAHLVSEFSRRYIDMPTAAIAIFGLPLDGWSSLEPDGAEMLHYMRPKALPRDVEED